MAKFFENKIDNNSDDIDLKKAIYIISKNKLFILSVTTIFTFGGIFYSLVKQPIWQGNFLIVVKKDSQNNTASKLEEIALPKGLTDIVGMSGGSDLKTQKEILSSPSILLPVYKFVKDEEKKKGYKEEKLSYENWLKKSMKIDFKKGTKVLSVNFFHKDKDIIIKTLDLISTKYKEFSQRERKNYLKDSIEYFAKQKEIATSNYKKSLKSFNKFSIENGLGDIDGFIELNTTNNRSNNSNFFQDPIKIENLIESSELLTENSKSNAGQRFSQQFSLLEKYESNYVDLSAKLKPNSITLKNLKLKIDNLKSSLKRPNEILIQFRDLEREAKRSEKLLAKIEKQFINLQLEKAKKTNSWEIISNPKVNKNRHSPKRKKLTIYFFITGLLLSIIYTLFNSFRKGFIYSLEEFNNLLNYEYLGNLEINDGLLTDLYIKKVLEEKNIKNNNVCILKISDNLFNSNKANEQEKLLINKKFKEISLVELSDKNFNEKIILFAFAENITLKNFNKLNNYLYLKKEQITGWFFLK